ncbi:MAG: hypothetical protein QOD83_2679 [Solirubrobacteraceae bacterium]|jgi:hypothetical protein|nr:hypothetical protein [Solirubrobacteraceae bacterium]
MTAATADIAPLEALARIDELIDLSDILRKLADPEEGKGLATEDPDIIEAEYRRFLVHLAPRRRHRAVQGRRRYLAPAHPTPTLTHVTATRCSASFCITSRTSG